MSLFDLLYRNLAPIQETRKNPYLAFHFTVMERYEYPLLYYRYSPDAVLGFLVGAGLQVLEKDLNDLKSVMATYLQKQYKKNGYFPGWHLENASLKSVEINLRPSFSDDNVQYSMVESLRVKVYALTGHREGGAIECYLPWLNEHFVCFEPSQLDTLLQHTASMALRRMAPEQIFRLRSYDKPGLDKIVLRVNTNKLRAWGDTGFERSYPVLEQLTEQMPLRRPKAVGAPALPETAWEMDETVADVAERIAQTRANVLLVGHPGAGKSTVLLSALRKITRSRQAPDSLTFWRMMSQRMVAGAKYLGEWQQTCEALIEELESASGLLWVPDIAQLIVSGGSSPEDSVAAFMLSFLQQGRLQMIGEATPQELDSMRRMLPGFTECFQVVYVPELPEKKVQSILEKYAALAAQQQKINIKPEALAVAYRILNRYYPYEQFPGKGIRFLSRCLNEALIRGADTIDKQDVVDTFVQQTGFPPLFLRDDMPIQQEELRGFFQHRIKGQHEAIDRLCQIVKVFKAGLNNPHKPIATLLFAGPTGVGKTAAAKALADYFFGKGRSQTPLVRLDMSEFQFPWQVSRLVGEGKEPGQLVREIRERPFSVLLLDEIEKADDSIFDALLTTLDEGMLSDALGRVTNFRNSIIIMTTNLGSGGPSIVGFNAGANQEDATRAAIRGRFRPEFVNRIDDVVVFQPLGKEDIKRIAAKEMEEFAQREGLVSKGIGLSVSDRVIEHLAEIGFDQVYGARPLQRALERIVADPVAAWLLANPEQRNITLELDYAGTLMINVLSLS